MGDLFDTINYPDAPAHQGGETSKAAAKSMAGKAPTIRDQVIAALGDYGPRASFELAALIGKSYRSVQPRTSELAQMGKVSDSGKRRIDPETGKEVIVWKLGG